jgi:hypothetical protein
LSEHELGTVEADSLNFQANFALAWLLERQVLNLENVCVSGFMKANDLWHDGFPVWCQLAGTKRK